MYNKSMPRKKTLDDTLLHVDLAPGKRLGRRPIEDPMVSTTFRVPQSALKVLEEEAAGRQMTLREYCRSVLMDRAQQLSNS